MTLADRIIQFNNSLDMSHIKLPRGIRAMNPFKGENAKLIARVTDEFYHKYYDDNEPRNLILGINPGRFGAGLTGVPFSDTKRLRSDCDIKVAEVSSHEPSSVFVYEVVRAYGGVKKFYRRFFINSVCPLGFVKTSDEGREVNFNYYDQRELQEAVTPFILKTLKAQLALGLSSDVVWCMGGGKNYKFLKTFNDQHKLFGKIKPLDHPRYIVQYKTKLMDQYVEKYLESLGTE